MADLHHHGDREVGAGLVDLAVNVFPGRRPGWLDVALEEGLKASDAYPDPASAERALAVRYERGEGEVLATAGSAEAFGLIARWRAWRSPVVVHPQFAEPHAALLRAGHDVTEVVLPRPFDLDPALVPDDADLVMVGNPTNPTGVLHPAARIRALLAPGRVVVVDEAFMDAVPGEPETLLGDQASALAGLVVLRSLTKHWGIPGVRAGFLTGDPRVVDDLRQEQAPWSVSSTAIAAMLACSTPAAAAESSARAMLLTRWREHLEAGLRSAGVEHVESEASYVLARVGDGMHGALREAGFAVRRCDTFPGLDGTWVRIAARPPEVSDQLVAALSALRPMP